MCTCGGQDCMSCYPGSASEIRKEEKIAYISQQEGVHERDVEDLFDLDDYVYPDELRDAGEEEEWERDRDQ